jgi:hypothetical protein
MADNRPLTELSDKELPQALANHAKASFVFSYNNVREELERRIQQRNANRTFDLAVLAWQDHLPV